MKNEIEDLIAILGNKFSSQFCQIDHNSALHNDFAEQRLLMAKTWFYKLFENIIAKEAKNPKYDIKVCIFVFKLEIKENICFIFLHLIFIIFILDIDLSHCVS